MAADDESQENQQPAKKSKSRTIILACVGMAFVVIVVVFVKFLMFPDSGARIESGGVELGSGTAETEPGEIVQMWEVLTNLAKPDQDTFISAKVAVELDAKRGSKEEKALKEELNSRKIELKQVIEEIFQSRTRDDLSTETGREGTRQEMLRKINARLQKGSLRRILTTDVLFS